MKGYLSVCAIYKNEARYLAEWIEFHLLAGVEHFFLYDNDSTDDHREVLAPYMRAGLVTVTDWPGLPGSGPRLQPLPRGEPARLALDRVHRPGRVPVLAADGAGAARCCAGHEHLPAVAALWIIFGTSGHKTPPAGLVIENYTWRRIWPRRSARVEEHRRPAPRSARVHRAACLPLRRSRGARGRCPAFASLGDLRLNHYITKSEQELKAKLEAPEAATGGLRQVALRRPAASRSRCVDETILPYAPACGRPSMPGGSASRTAAPSARRV